MSTPDPSSIPPFGHLHAAFPPSPRRGLVKCAPQGGEVHVTLKDKPPYSGWNVK